MKHLALRCIRLYSLSMKGLVPTYENRLTADHRLPEDFLGIAVSLRRLGHPQPHDAFDPPLEEMDRIRQERKARTPRIGEGVATLALRYHSYTEDVTPIGCFHAHVLGKGGDGAKRGQVFIDSVWVHKMYMDSGVAMSLAQAGLAVFKHDRQIANAAEIMPPLLSGALDSHDQSAMFETPAVMPNTVEEAQAALGALLHQEVMVENPITVSPQLTPALI